uniref:Methyltransferase FkbM domain-containing protein n=1 Tax=mine drainage metagenome TaxID=410659 RepID=E6Q516_9ZZZZ
MDGHERIEFSQGGEDGVLLSLLMRIGTTNRFFVEFGVSDGAECCTAALAIKYHWSGLMIEGDSASYERLCTGYRSLGVIEVRFLQRFIDRDSIVKIFEDEKVPENLDLLSIDVDGNDYWIWESLLVAGYRPRIIVVEYNAAKGPRDRWVMAYNPAHTWDGSDYFGASLASLAALGERYGYALIGTSSNGINAYFVRDGLVLASGFRAKSAVEAFHPPRRFLGMTLPSGAGPAVSL